MAQLWASRTALDDVGFDAIYSLTTDEEAWGQHEAIEVSSRAYSLRLK